MNRLKRGFYYSTISDWDKHFDWIQLKAIFRTQTHIPPNWNESQRRTCAEFSLQLTVKKRWLKIEMIPFNLNWLSIQFRLRLCEKFKIWNMNMGPLCSSIAQSLCFRVMSMCHMHSISVIKLRIDNICVYVLFWL